MSQSIVPATSRKCKDCGQPSDNVRCLVCRREKHRLYMRARKGQAPEPKCIDCGTVRAEGQRGWTKRCPPCMVLFRTKRTRERLGVGRTGPVYEDKTCPECGASFRGYWHQTYCSQQCYARVNRRTRDRRLRKAKIKSEPVYYADIYARDKGICQLCGKHVSPDLAAPDRMSGTIDHVIPLAKGGSHAPENCQLAHYGCNSSKRHSMPQTLF